jgi:hypothetical protein
MPVASSYHASRASICLFAGVDLRSRTIHRPHFEPIVSEAVSPPRRKQELQADLLSVVRRRLSNEGCLELEAMMNDVREGARSESESHECP